MKGYKNLEELKKAWEPFGFRVNEKGELSVIGERDGKEYKIGKVKKRVISEEEIENFLENSNNQERERRESKGGLPPPKRQKNLKSKKIKS